MKDRMDQQIGDSVKGEIIDFTHEGNGLMKVENFAIFVPGGIIGDMVEVEINKRKKNYGIGLITRIIQPSSHRVNESTKSISGETPLINYKYEEQLKWKRSKVKADLKKFAGLTDVKV